MDVLAWSDDRIYIIECKNAILPSNSHEIRGTYDHLQKAFQQLDFSKEALSDETFQNQYFPNWGIPKKERSVHTCVLLGNRLFTVPNGLRHSVRYAYEFNMMLTSGMIYSNLGRWSCWKETEFSDDDLARFLSDEDPLSNSFIHAMVPYREIINCRGRIFELHSYMYNALKHLELQDRLLRVIDQKWMERQEMRQFISQQDQNI